MKSYFINIIKLSWNEFEFKSLIIESYERIMEVLLSAFQREKRGRKILLFSSFVTLCHEAIFKFSPWTKKESEKWSFV